MQNTNKATKLVYILSETRSGSTLADFVLGSLPDTFSTGELINLPWQLNRQSGNIANKDNHCTCGRLIKDCEIWGQVVEDMGTSLYDNGISRFRTSLSKHIMAPSQPLTERLYRKIIIHILGNQRLSSYSDAILLRHNKTAEQNWKLLDKISEVSGKKNLIDSSKDILRFLMLYSLRPDDILPVLLIRNPLGVCYSHFKSGRNISRTARNWALKNNMFVKLLSMYHISKYQVIKYEDITNNHNETRRESARMLNIEYPGDIGTIPTQDYHIIAGNNKTRFAGEIRIKSDKEWKVNLSQKQQSRIILKSKKLNPALLELYKNTLK